MNTTMTIRPTPIGQPTIGSTSIESAKHTPALRNRAAIQFAVLACVASTVSAQAVAADKPHATCVDVEVDGKRALSIDCLNHQLSPAPASPPTEQLPASEALFTKPGNQLGLFNRAAISNGMGNTFGKSAFPQRPVPIQPVNPFNRGTP